MTGLADIAPLTETVTIRGKPIEVSGIDLLDIPKLLLRFPSLAAMFSTTENWSLAALLTQPREVIGAALAAGCGQLGDEKAERGAANLKMDEKFILGAAVMRMTLQGDLGPFVDQVTALFGVDREAPEAKTNVRALKPLPPGAVRVRSMRPSQAASNG